MLFYVTSLYSVREVYLPQLYQQFQQLIPLIHESEVVVFTDCALPFEVPSNFHVIQRNLSDFYAYQKCLHANGRLPNSRNETKDTAEFMALMNTKVEMVWSAIPFFTQTPSHIAWIDAGIMKIVKDPVRIREAFASHQKVGWPARSVAVPGCWLTLAPPSSDAICWRFCGGFAVFPTGLLPAFYEALMAMLEAWLLAGHLVWEVNIWAALEWKDASWFTWWSADHNDTMLEVPGFLTRLA